MTVTALPLPAASLLPGLVAADAAFTEAGGVPLAGLAEAELGDAMRCLTRLTARAEALRLSVLAEADRRQVAEHTGDTSTDAWAAAFTGETREVMLGGRLLVTDLQERFHATQEAFAAGAISKAQVRVIVHALRLAPPNASPDQVCQAEELMVFKASGEACRSGRPMNPKRLRQAARRMFATIDADLADRHEAAMSGREERSAEALTFLRLGDNGDGTWSGSFCIPELHGHLFRQAIDALTAPRRWVKDPGNPGRIRSDPTVHTTNKQETSGHALCELLEHLPTDGWSAKNGVTLLVTMELDKLLQDLDEHGVPTPDRGGARLDTGTRISAGQARRLACNAGLVPAVLGTDSTVLDLGRSQRLHTEAQRRALAIEHSTCAIDGCDRPFAWCEVHHPVPWAAGGTTDLANALPLCGHHHRRAHDEWFTLRHHGGDGWRLHPRRRRRLSVSPRDSPTSPRCQLPG